MKKNYLFLILLVLPLVTRSAVNIDGIYYTLLSNEAYVTKLHNSYTGSIIIPSSITYDDVVYSVTGIEKEAFWYNNNIVSISIPSSIKKIGEYAFRFCDNLTSVHIDDLVAWCNISFANHESNPLSYAHHLYINGEEIKELVLPEGMTKIRDYIFYGCSGLTSIIIPDGVTTIGEGSFAGCNNLTDINIPDGVITIGPSAFANCSGLTSVIIPNSVKYIEYYSFYGCTSLTSITIPESVTSIGNSAFYYDNFKYVISLIKDPFEIHNLTFDVREDAILYVPKGTKSKYENTNGWNKFKNIVEIFKQCEKPSICYDNGNLHFTCETEGVEYVTNIKDSDVKTHYDSTITLTATYNISVYATKEGYDNSETATATLCWINAAPQTEGITNGMAQIVARPVLVKTENGLITVEGIDDRTNVGIYTTDGKQLGSAISKNNVATIATSIQPGSIAIVKVGEKAIKVIMK